MKKNEFDIYCHLHPDLPITRKDFRKMSSERREVGKIMQTALNNVKELCTVVDFNFSQTAVNSFANTFTNHRCDVFDYAILNNCINSQFLNIISDDSDFSTMEKITLYTANEKIL